MARRGKFGRSGTSQNLTMLVYQIMKQQMQDELDAILTSYKTNMEAGMYNSQFNGQNVDGEFVVSYYEQMLAGFPPGSTEYETINSKLEQFRQQYQTDLENLVIRSMNSGDKIDFGLLGSGFTNKGISEVELSDVRGWAEDRISQLRADGKETQADKLSGAVYVAGFNVDNDGKVAAVDRGELSYSQYAKWLKGELGSALNSGLTESSEAYRAILKAHANAVKQAKTEGEGKARENVEAAIKSAAAPAEAAAKALIGNYMSSGDAVMANIINDELAKTTSTSISPYFDVLKRLAAARQESGDQTYNAILNFSGVDGAGELFAQAASEYNTTLNDIAENGLGGLSASDKTQYQAVLVGLIGDGNAFVSNSGVGFFAGAGKNAMETFQRNLSTAGIAKSPDLSSGIQAVMGGHPAAVLGAFKELGVALESVDGSKAYGWLDTLANGYISTSLDPERLSAWDLTPDGKITEQEIFSLLDSGNVNAGDINTMMSGIMANMGGFDMPSSRLSPEAVTKLWVDSVANKWSMENKGSIAVADEAGVVTVTEPGNANLANSVAFNIPNYGIVWVAPQTINEKVADKETGAIDAGKLGGMSSVTVHKYPGLGSSTTNVGYADMMVRVSGPLTSIGGTTAQKTIIVPFDTYRKVLQHVGIDLEAESVISPNADIAPNIVVSFDGTGTMSDANKRSFFANVFTNPDSEFYIAKLRDPNTKQLIAPESVGQDYDFVGFVNPGADSKAFIGGLFNTGRAGIIQSANEYVARSGPGIPVSRETLIRSIVDQIPGLGGGVQVQTLRDAVTNSTVFQDKFNSMFPDFPVPVQTGAIGQAGYPTQVPQAPATQAPASPAQNPYIQTQAQSFINGAFRNAGQVGMNPARAAAPVTPAKPTAAPSIKPISPTPVSAPASTIKPTSYSTTTAKPKVTPSGTTGASGSVNTGYTRGIN